MGGGATRSISLDISFIPVFRSSVVVFPVAVIADISSNFMPMRRQLRLGQRCRPDSAGNTDENNLTVQ